MARRIGWERAILSELERVIDGAGDTCRESVDPRNLIDRDVLADYEGSKSYWMDGMDFADICAARDMAVCF